MKIKSFYDKNTYTLTYVVYDEQTKDAVVIDPVWDYDPGTYKTSTESVSKVLNFLKENNLKLHFLLETHAHADHLSGSQLIKEQYPQADVVIGDKITEVQKVFKKVFGLPDDFPSDGSQFDRLIKDKEQLTAGSLSVEAIATPGHTPACLTYKIGDALFTGDALFMPDYGTGRCDFPAGSAEDLYDSITGRIYSQPDETRIFVGHDYQPGGREVQYMSTVGEQKKENIRLKGDTTKEDFVKFRTERDSGLSAPKLLYQSVQVNIAAGDFPVTGQKGQNGNDSKAYLKVPVNIFRAPVSPEQLESEHTVEFAEV